MFLYFLFLDKQSLISDIAILPSVCQAMQSLRLALQPSVEDISLTWDLPAGVTAKVLSPTIQNIFQGQRSVVFAQLTGQVGASVCHFQVTFGKAFYDQAFGLNAESLFFLPS